MKESKNDVTTGRQLEEKICRTGQERGLRELAFKEKLLPLEQLATATLGKVCGAVAEKYTLMFDGGYEDNNEWLALARREDVDKVRQLLVFIVR